MCGGAKLPVLRCRKDSGVAKRCKNPKEIAFRVFCYQHIGPGLLIMSKSGLFIFVGRVVVLRTRREVIPQMKNTFDLEKRERVVTFLNRHEVDFLDKIGKDALFSTGIKLSRAKLIAWFVDLMKKLNISGENIKSEAEFEERIIKLLKQNPHLPR